ncbi:hypothetical protein L873DRAFT_1790164 [Choiromyces venosus 120613-1]|uniref:Uncharacterized protein n=1 Tax=Choiromyces venosus 120613-1 TaxID=1336337 RepID=A0A3N4JP53_9PEZI|nr:hypothetical protein L873DRAFT_1790164 [Choiromyces venosus 120613-1]
MESTDKLHILRPRILPDSPSFPSPDQLKRYYVPEEDYEYNRPLSATFAALGIVLLVVLFLGILICCAAILAGNTNVGQRRRERQKLRKGVIVRGLDMIRRVEVVGGEQESGVRIGTAAEEGKKKKKKGGKKGGKKDCDDDDDDDDGDDECECECEYEYEGSFDFDEKDAVDEGDEYEGCFDEKESFDEKEGLRMELEMGGGSAGEGEGEGGKGGKGGKGEECEEWGEVPADEDLPGYDAVGFDEMGEMVDTPCPAYIPRERSVATTSGSASDDGYEYGDMLTKGVLGEKVLEKWRGGEGGGGSSKRG